MAIIERDFGGGSEPVPYISPRLDQLKCVRMLHTKHKELHICIYATKHTQIHTHEKAGLLKLFSYTISTRTPQIYSLGADYDMTITSW